MKQTLFTICVILILSSLNAQNKVEVPFAKESLDKADKNLEIRRISAQLDGAFLLDRRAQIAPLLEE
ncbi:MAG: hypothetical protein K8S54_07340, partial [Spirochaetia bacterium]|nr:hypothetical protein [Spirochaetia bacterium]